MGRRFLWNVTVLFGAIIVLSEASTVRPVRSSEFIIDTDPGVDDAAALILALSDSIVPRPKVHALTLSAGNGNRTTVIRNARRLLCLMNAVKIPMFAGAERAILESVSSDNYFGEDAFGEKPDLEPKPVDHKEVESFVEKEAASNAIIRMAKERPGKITIVCLGPLTNLALALRLEPRLTQWLRGVVVLGGNMRGQGNVRPAVEYNFYFDPEAAHIVVREMAPTIVTWEMALKTTASWEWYDNTYMKTDTPTAKFLAGIEKFAFSKSREGGGDLVFVDSLAMAIAAVPELTLKSERRPATVELHGTETRGQLVVDWRSFIKSNSSHPLFITAVDVEKMKKLAMTAVRYSPNSVPVCSR